LRSRTPQYHSSIPKIGCHPPATQPKSPEKFVLKNFSKEKKIIKNIIKTTIKAIEMVIVGEIKKAMSKYNH